MRARMAAMVLGLVACALAAATRHGSADRSGQPYDYGARERLVQSCQRAGDHASAYYHAAWLAWLGPRRYAEPAKGILRDRRARDRAGGASRGGAISVVIAAVDAARQLSDTCLNGAIAHQAPRVRAEVAKLVEEVDQARPSVGGGDPVARAALARLCLALDDCLRLENTPASLMARRQVLRRAASLAGAVALALPDSPGAHRLVATARARLAEVENRAELWDMAIEECEMAHALDPEDPSLSEMVWGLHLRAGHWEEAERWRVGAPAARPEQEAGG